MTRPPDEHADDVQHILIVDDEEAILRSLKRLLRRDQYELHLATSGEEALEILQQHPIAVIICDQRMPKMSGSEVLARSVEIRPDAYRITLTGFTDLKAAQRSINDGCVNQFLMKPWDDEHLRSIVRSGVETHRLTHENEQLRLLTAQQNVELEAMNKKLHAKVREATTFLRNYTQRLKDIKESTEQTLRETVALLTTLLEADTPGAAVHARRVAKLAAEAAREMRLRDREVFEIECAAFLHEIGGIAHLFSGEGSATSEVDAADLGSAILGRISGFRNVAGILAALDTPYQQDGVCHGINTPIGARLIAAANAWDEAAHPGGESRRCIDTAAGFAALDKGSGTRFDPGVVLVVKDVIECAAHETDDATQQELEVSMKQLRVGMVLTRDLENLDGVLLLAADAVIQATHLSRIRDMCRLHRMPDTAFVVAEVADREQGAAA